MARIEIKFKLNPGREGVSLGKLSKQTENIELFLRSLAGDLGLDSSTDMWRAKKFKNGSCIYEACFDGVVDDDVAEEFNECTKSLALLAINSAKNSRSLVLEMPEKISLETRERFSNMRERLDHDEPLGIAIFDSKTKNKWKWKYIDRLQFEELGRSIEKEIRYFGAIMGVAYEWTPGADKPFIMIRELNSGELVKCLYKDQDENYAKISRVFQRKKAIIIVSGEITLNQITNKQEITSAHDFEYAPEFNDHDYDMFFGSAEGLSGDLSSEKFIELGRADD